jgi:phosphoribosyl 1,2-cyclic phosphate phosphodiesterase
MAKVLSFQVLFLGTGASSGVPVIGCHCAVCTSPDVHNRRLRPSVLLTYEGKRFLIDVGPDFRQQALRYNIDRIDGVLLTHAHYDHVGGLDELRAFYIHHREATPILCSIETLDELKKKFDYLFKPKVEGASLAAQLHFQVLENSMGETDFLGVPLKYVTYKQGKMSVNGFIFGKFAYLTDIREYSEEIFSYLEGVEILVLSAIGEKPSHMHLCFEEGVAFAHKAGVKQCLFTHLSHQNDHQKINRMLPKECQLAYDGQFLEWI